MSKKVKVLIIDDSAVMRKLLTEGLSSSPYIEVIGTAMDPYIAVKRINKLAPDVLTLDIEMPRMDGITFLSKLMVSHPMPVIMVSSLTEKGADATLKSLEMGAVDFICKPVLENKEDSSDDFIKELKDKIFTAANVTLNKNYVVKHRRREIEPEKRYSTDAVLAKKNIVHKQNIKDKVIAIGASTGGTEVVAEILQNMDTNCPGIVVAQHMPEKFTYAFANRINEKSAIYVKEAEDGERLYSGVALIAKGDKHLILKSDSKGFYVSLNDGERVNRHKPSVDVLFRSVAQEVGENSMGIILTGMGDDGANGLVEMKKAGADTIAQDKESCVVFGMPKEAINRGGANKILNIEEIISYLKNFCNR